jgi:hypothetical protein
MNSCVLKSEAVDCLIYLVTVYLWYVTIIERMHQLDISIHHSVYMTGQETAYSRTYVGSV